jgi:glycosyltransferase involved in cell wall biosynthesis
VLGGLIGRFATRLERRQIAGASGVVPIANSFVERYETWGLDTSHVSVIPNWAPLDDIVPVTRNNRWAAENDLDEDSFRLLYSGTLGRKHNPRLLLDLLDGVQAAGISASLTICSEGIGADDIRQATRGRDDVRLLGFQPADRLAEVLSAGDVVIALLEPTASQFSVPSKVLSYFAAGRPVAGLMPLDNPAAHDIHATGGCVATPDREGVIQASEWIAEVARSPTTLQTIGAGARLYAESRFDIKSIADQFEAVFERATRVSR